MSNQTKNDFLFKVTMYRACLLHTEIQAETPEQALNKVKSAMLLAPSLEDAVDSIELDEDYDTTRITVSLSEAETEDNFNVLVKVTPDVQTLKNLLAIPQTEEEYKTLILILQSLLKENNSLYQPLIGLISGLTHDYLMKSEANQELLVRIPFNIEIASRVVSGQIKGFLINSIQGCSTYDDSLTPLMASHLIKKEYSEEGKSLDGDSAKDLQLYIWR